MKPARHFAKAILLVCLPLAVAVSGPALPTLAQGAPDARGAKGPIGKQDLLEALRQQKIGGPKVAGHVVSGPDVIDILGQGDMPIELRDCVIENGLDLRERPVVTVPIIIENCEIRPAPLTSAMSAGNAIYARETGFEEEVTLRSSALAGPVEFTGADFRKNANFTHSRFAGAARFTGARFTKAAMFSRSHFNSAQFDTASFGGEAAFRSAEFGNTAHFDRATFSKQADFRRAVFRAKQTFLATFEGPVLFKDAWFGGEVSFNGQIFPEVADFDKVEFGGAASFAGARFEQDARFRESTFLGRAEFKAASFQRLAGFSAAEFLSESNFGYAHFAEAADFLRVRFRLRAFFVSLRVEQSARFREATFEGEAMLNRASFGESANFRETIFEDRLGLTGADFGAYADFRGARIARLDLNSSQVPTILRSRLDLRGAQIGEVHVQDVIFEADVDFSDATFGLPFPRADSQEAEAPAAGTTILRFATFEDDVSFARAQFAGRLSLESVNFQGHADFTDVDFSAIGRDSAPSFSFSYIDFGDLRLQWRQLPEPRYWVQSQDDAIHGTMEKKAPVGRPEPISRTLVELEGHFRAVNHLEDANAAYYQRKLAELREARADGWNGARFLLEAEWLFWGLVCGYGTKLWWALAWTLLVNAVFTLIYWSSATVTRHPHPDSKEEFSFRLRLLDLPKQYATDRAGLPVKLGPLRKFIDSLRVSSVILFKLGYRDTTLAGRFGPLPIAYLVAVEWALGFYLLAALTVTLANTQPLINRLVSGVF